MNKKYFDIHGPVFWPSALLIILFIVITIAVGKPMEQVFVRLQDTIADNARWFFILSVNIFLFFVLALAFGKLGKLRLGGQDAKPEFKTMTWFAMLFSAGMGIGILFWSVAEPVFHYISPPRGDGRTIESAKSALGVTFLHWGLHAWGIYALIGLGLAFFTFNKKLPLTIRSLFYPLLGAKIYGPIGNIIDIMAVIATLFGLATSLGLGVKQVSAGLSHLFQFKDTVALQVILISGITLLATISVVTGLKKGVRFLSEWNVRIALVLLIILVAIGPTLFIFNSFVQNIGYYLANFMQMSFWTESYQQTDWQNNWTVFYWAWWISWSPFVGMFIARISKGRTIREFVLGVLIVPSLVTFFWLSSFGGSAIFLEINGIGNIVDAVQENVATAIYVLFENFPFSTFTSALAILLVTSFFVTSSDSGSLVIDSITAGGKLDAPVGQRVFWAVSEGLIAAVLLVGGGLNALQTAAITTGLPFTFILLLACYSIYKGVNSEFIALKYSQATLDREKQNNLLQDKKNTKSLPSKNYQEK